MSFFQLHEYFFHQVIVGKCFILPFWQFKKKFTQKLENTHSKCLFTYLACYFFVFKQITKSIFFLLECGLTHKCLLFFTPVKQIWCLIQTMVKHQVLFLHCFLYYCQYFLVTSYFLFSLKIEQFLTILFLLCLLVEIQVTR